MKTHIYIYFLMLTALLLGCNTFDKGPKMVIQLKIEEPVNSESQKTKFIAQIQKRLEAVGAKDVLLTEENESEITVSFRGTIKSEKIQQNFAVQGNLEFFEVANSTMIILNHLIDTYGSTDEDDDEQLESVEKDNDFKEFMSLIRLQQNHDLDGIVGFVDVKDRAKIEALDIYKKSFYVKSIKKRVKFLVGNAYQEDQLSLRLVVVNMKDEAPLNGSCITETSVRHGFAKDSYNVTIQMNNEGAKIWEQLTEKAYQERHLIAVVIDDFVYSAPSVTNGGISGGITEISGSFSQEEATELARIIKSGTIPKVTIQAINILKETY